VVPLEKDPRSHESRSTLVAGVAGPREESIDERLDGGVVTELKETVDERLRESGRGKTSDPLIVHPLAIGELVLFEGSSKTRSANLCSSSVETTE